MITTLAEALAERGYETLTPVQEAVSDPALAARDLLVSAQTGSGKTVGFGLAIAPTLLDETGRFGAPDLPMALVVAPTRELAFQVRRELDWLYAKAGARIASCVGGMDMRDERRALERGAHIVVGTPGRLCDHLRRGSLDISALRAVVLDEADEMLDLGFREDLEYMLGEAPEDRRTLLFSATVPPAIAALAETFQRDAERINTIGHKEQHADISYQVMQVAPGDSDPAIFNLLRFYHDETAIVFANTRAQVNHLTARLANRGLSVVTLSGELSQSERSHALQAMRDGRARVCVATDVAARGIDLPNLTLVIHADLPTNTETLLHRSGRTGRAGRKGISALMVEAKAAGKAERLLKWAKINAEWTVPPSVDAVLAKDESRLLTDPTWDDPMTEEQTAFAAKLLAERSPETVAAAYLRLYQSRNGAPEDLLPADFKPAPKERKPFGPSKWLSLSQGRNDGAEARWLLPLLCRAGGIDKTAIGAIRVQDSETFVELSEAAYGGFFDAIGPDGEMEDGMVATALDTPPNLPTERPRRDRPERGDRGDRFERKGGFGRKDRFERNDRFDRKDRGPRPERAPREDAKPWHADLPEDGPRPERAERPRPVKPRSEPKPDTRRFEKSDRRDESGDERPARKYEPRDSAPREDRPRGRSDRSERSDNPYSKPRGKSDFGGDKPFGKPRGKSEFGDKPYGKPRSKSDFGDDKPFSKSRPKPAAKGKPKPVSNAKDTSKRFTPPGKPATRPARGGEAVPRRKS